MPDADGNRSTPGTLTKRIGPYGWAAPLYLSAGWVGVLPLHARSKEAPPVMWVRRGEKVSFTGHDGVDPTAAQVRAWVTGRSRGNVALRLPETVVGLDLDLYKPAGAASFAALVDELGPLPPTWRSSARGGESGIRLFRVPTGLVWAERQAGAGIELIHRTHRYAVVWPSLHPDLPGARYRWWTPDGHLANRVPRVDELPALPAVWGRRLSVPPPTSPGRVTTVETHLAGGVRGSYAAAALAGTVAELSAMGPGAGRNIALNRKAFHLGGLIGAGELDEHTVREALLAAAQANGHVAKHGQRQTLATINSGLRAGIARPRRRSA